MALHPDEIRTVPGEEEGRIEPTFTVRLEGGQRLKVRRCVLAVTKGPHQGEEKTFDAERIRIGNDARADFPLTRDQTTSRGHFEVLFTEKGWLLVDLNSTNGTHVDGRRVERAYLGLTSEIRAGSTELRFTAVEEVTELVPAEGSFGELSATSESMRRVFAAARKVAELSLPVLLEGEPGCGKSALAAAIHQASGRTGPLVSFDASDDGEPIEEALLGEEGAFGRARSGTLVLRRIEALPVAVQARVARAIERETSVRLVATSQGDLAARVRAGTFREELFFRLSVLPLRLPPLRERPEDIGPLVARALEEGPLPRRGLTPEALAALEAYGWPGNVRELKNLAAELRATVAEDPVPKKALPARIQGARAAHSVDFNEHLSFHDAKEQLVGRFERAYLQELLGRTGGNLSEAARQSGLHRKSIERLVKKYQLDLKAIRGG